jgi:lysylphosphatidylglycerol synthetase-like protein (DUF2156 family)/nucleoside-diphosphate-sugar epimerase
MPEQRLANLGLNLSGVEAVLGDITDPAIMDTPAPRVDEFWHIAGLTEFHESKRPQLEQVNIEGTRNALALARRWNVERYFHISTAYVAGIHDGVVQEDELLPNPVFRNPYEETKYRGEQLVRASDLPWIVIRPSILLGDSRTGECDSDKMAYGVCKSYFMVGQWVRREQSDESEAREYIVKGAHDATKNCVCVDDAVRLLLDIRRHGEPGRTYHCTHPNPTTVGDLSDAFRHSCDTPFIRLAADWPPTPDQKQRFLSKACRTYELYMTRSDPVFMLDGARGIAEWNPRELDASRLRFLFDAYVAELCDRKNAADDTSLDMTRFEAVRRYGSFALAYNSMSRQFKAFTAPGVDGYLPYAMVDSTVMMPGDPLSDQSELLLREFVAWCDRENRNFCALQVSHASAAVLHALGCYVNKLGIETEIDLARFDNELRGKEYQEIRNCRNVAERFGVVVRAQPISDRSPEDLRTLFADWIGRKKNRKELHLLLRPPVLAPEPGVRQWTAEYRGRLIATVFFTPIHRAARITGYYADVERYNMEGTELPGRLNLMKLIQYEAARAFQREGVETIALGMSPLYGVRESEFNDNPELTGLFEQLFEESALYAFRGIAKHKREYPCRVEHPVYIATRTQAAADEVLDLLKGVGLLG